MTAFWSSLTREAQTFSWPEVIAVAAAVLYLLLAIRQNIWCWFFAGLSTAIYVYLFVDARLYMESALNLFYFAMAVYGWYSWHAGRGDDKELPVVRWPLGRHAMATVTILGISALSGLLLSEFSDAAFPYVDSMTTWGAIWSTFLVARKVFENWWYWLVIDSVSVAIYWSRDLQLTALLFVIYLLLIPFGMWAWWRSLRERES